MLRPLICGSGGFHNLDSELDLCSSKKAKNSSKCSSKLCSRGGGGGGEVKKRKNPYATRGLDKFSSLVDDLKEKRRRIYAQIGESDDLYVWFNFSGSDDCKPIILKLKNKNQKIDKKDKLQDIEKTLAKVDKYKNAKPSFPATVVHKTQMISDKGMKKWERLMGSSYYTDVLRRRPLLCLLGVVILILILLTMFGRSATVIWVTVGWYLLPSTKLTTFGSRKESATKPIFNNKKTTSKDMYQPRRAATADIVA
ncbi:hypothetical protein QQ045_031386 [Rhodiola kirilowii]